MFITKLDKNFLIGTLILQIQMKKFILILGEVKVIRAN